VQGIWHLEIKNSYEVSFDESEFYNDNESDEMTKDWIAPFTKAPEKTALVPVSSIWSVGSFRAAQVRTVPHTNCVYN
jgi:hypothetical protein